MHVEVNVHSPWISFVFEQVSNLMQRIVFNHSVRKGLNKHYTCVLVWVFPLEHPKLISGKVLSRMDLVNIVWIAHWPKHSSVYPSLSSWELFFPRCKRKSLMFLPPSITRVTIGLKMNHKLLNRFPWSCKYLHKGMYSEHKQSERISNLKSVMENSCKSYIRKIQDRQTAMKDRKRIIERKAWSLHYDERRFLIIVLESCLL